MSLIINLTPNCHFKAHQERAYQEYVANKAKERAIQQEQYFEQLITTIQAELNSICNIYTTVICFMQVNLYLYLIKKS